MANGGMFVILLLYLLLSEIIVQKSSSPYDQWWMDILDGSLLHYLHMRGHGVLCPVRRWRHSLLAGLCLPNPRDSATLAADSPVSSPCLSPSEVDKAETRGPATIWPTAPRCRSAPWYPHQIPSCSGPGTQLHPPHTLKVTPFTSDSLRKLNVYPWVVAPK